MEFKKFVEYLEQFQKLSSRNEMTELISKLIAELESKEIKQAIYFLNGRVTPKFDSLDFNFAIKLMLTALDGVGQGFMQVVNEQANAKEIYAQCGDIGETAFIIKNRVAGSVKRYSVSEIHSYLIEIIDASGSGSQSIKTELYKKLMDSVSALEAKFISRIIVGKLRLGLSDKTILDGLSWYKVGDKSLRNLLDIAYGVRSDIGEIARVVAETDNKKLGETLKSLTIVPGIPVASKLVEREKSVENVWKRMGECYLQPKLDGLRAQIHFVSGKAKIFSRNMEDMTEMFPDLVKYTEDFCQKNKVSSIVLDSEAIGFNKDNGEYLSFQDTIQRKRKYGVDDKAVEIPVKALTFDLLFINGEDIGRKDIEYRLAKLKEIVKEGTSNSKLIEILETVIVKNEKEMSDYFEKQVSKGLEGVIVKKFGTSYEPGTRNFDWIKLKASIKNDMIDSIDGVVMGYYLGRGSRQKFGIGAILVGIYDKSDGKYKTVAKVGTGITDELFITIKNDLLGITTKDMPKEYEISKILLPDVYVEPKIVVVVDADEVTRSKSHTAALDKEGRGLSMRFPRLKIWNRQDKNSEDSTSEEELTRIFNFRNSKDVL